MNSKDKKKVFAALSSAAMALPGISNVAKAATVDPGYSIGYRYTNYAEEDVPADIAANGDAVERYDIDVHQLRFRAAIGDTKEITVNALSEEMSGASPLHVEPGENGEPLLAMSGATIEEERQDVNLSFRSVGATFEYSVGASMSTENDYDSLGINASYTHFFNSNNTSVSIGASYSDDELTPTQVDDENPELDLRPEKEEKSSYSITVGATHNFSKSLVGGISYSYANYDGFLSDPYKQAYIDNENPLLAGPVADSRPGSRDQTATTLTLRKYLSAVDAALHFDYRYYQNSWSLESNTIDLDWYQNIGERWKIIPGVRYYTQTEASFYENFYEEERENGFYSSDYRLSPFEALSYKLKVSWYSQNMSAVHFSAETYEAEATDDDKANPGLLEFTRFTVGFDFNF